MGTDQLSPFLHYLATRFSDGERLPSLAQISQDLGISLAALREQLEVARALGLVEVKPRTGIRRMPYEFHTAISQGLKYVVLAESQAFDRFAELRTRIEMVFWEEAVASLLAEDHQALCELVQRAENKLSTVPPQIPHNEHRELHLLIYRRLHNPFVTGILETYWELYEAVGLALYADLEYLKTVWQYHRRMVEAIQNGDVASGYRILVEHANLLMERPHQLSR
jgi:DNA-binding FadR family transcriptional regulator